MPGPNTPTSHLLAAAASTVGSWASPVLATLITVTNQGTARATVTVDGSTPVIDADNTYTIEAGGFEEIPIQELTSLEGGSGSLTIKGISSAALSLWIEVDQ